jgi:hypothetical protein
MKSKRGNESIVRLTREELKRKIAAREAAKAATHVR